MIKLVSVIAKQTLNMFECSLVIMAFLALLTSFKCKFHEFIADTTFSSCAQIDNISIDNSPSAIVPVLRSLVMLVQVFRNRHSEKQCASIRLRSILSPHSVKSYQCVL
jgi:hypothetical protein